MPTVNTPITEAWTKLAGSSDADLLVTWSEPVTIEVATTAADAAPAVNGHKLSPGDAITRGLIGPGYVWARLQSGSFPEQVQMVVSK